MEWKYTKQTNFKLSVAMSSVITLMAKHVELNLGMIYSICFSSLNYYQAKRFHCFYFLDCFVAVIYGYGLQTKLKLPEVIYCAVENSAENLCRRCTVHDSEISFWCYNPAAVYDSFVLFC
jgi:hypothetical protein